MFDIKLLGEAIRGARWKKRITQQELAEMAGVSRMTVVGLEKGTTDTRLKSLQAVLGVIGLELAIKRIGYKTQKRMGDPPPDHEPTDNDW